MSRYAKQVGNVLLGSMVRDAYNYGKKQAKAGYEKYKRIGVKRTTSYKARLNKPIHHFKRMRKLTSRSVTGASPISYKQVFALNDLDVGAGSYTDGLKAMYDFYRINCVVLKIVPRFNVNQQNIANLQIPNIVTVRDYNGEAVTSEDQLLQYSGAKISRGHKIIKIKIVPAVETAVDIAGSQKQHKFKPWLSTADPGTVHNSILVYAETLKKVDDTAATGTDKFTYDIYATYYFSCKGLK